MTGWVVCESCGTRMKAGRGHCLRCLAELPDADAPTETTMWESLGLSKGNRLLLAVTVSVVVLAFVAVISFTQQDAMDDVARGVDRTGALVSTAKSAASVAAPGSPDVATNVPAYEPVTFLESTRNRTTAVTSGDFASARSAYERALVQRPDDAEAFDNLGQVLVRLRHPDEAVARFEQAVALVPGKSTYHFNLAHAVAELGDLDRAIAEYRLAAKLLPDDYASQYNVAMALHKKGDEQAAIPEFQRAISLAPGEPGFHASLGVSLEKAGRIAEAMGEYRAFLQMEPGAPGAAQLKAHVEALSASARRPSAP